MHILNSEFYYNALNAAYGHQGVRIISDNFTYWGESSKFRWDYLKLFQMTVFHDLPDCIGNIELLAKLISQTKFIPGLFVEIRPLDIVSPEINNILLQTGFKREDHLSAVIKIQDPELMWKNFGRDKQKGIRQAASRYGLTIIESSSSKELLFFYDMLKKLYVSKNHPIKDYSYFLSLFNNLPQSSIRLLLCKYDNKTIAGQLALFWQKRITAFYTATDRDHMNKHAGDLLIWHLLKNIGYEEGYQIFDFGGGGNPYKPYGPREYKRGFGSKFENVGRYTYSNKPYYNLVKYIYKLRLKS